MFNFILCRFLRISWNQGLLSIFIELSVSTLTYYIKTNAWNRKNTHFQRSWIRSEVNVMLHFQDTHHNIVFQPFIWSWVENRVFLQRIWRIYEITWISPLAFYHLMIQANAFEVPSLQSIWNFGASFSPITSKCPGIPPTPPTPPLAPTPPLVPRVP